MGNMAMTSGSRRPRVRSPSPEPARHPIGAFSNNNPFSTRHDFSDDDKQDWNLPVPLLESPPHVPNTRAAPIDWISREQFMKFDTPHIVTPRLALLARNDNRRYNTWYLDSCRGQHKVGSEHYISNAIPTPAVTYVTMANNTRLRASAQGIVVLKARGSRTHITLNDALIMQNLHFNLLSAAQLMDCGVDLSTDPETRDILLHYTTPNKARKQIGRAHSENGVYILDFDIPDCSGDLQELIDLVPLHFEHIHHRPSAPAATATATAATAATAAPPYCALMASLRVLAFDHEGRPIQFNTWLDDLQLYLLSNIKDGVSLFDHVSGAATAPPTTADSATRSQWLSRDAAARLAIRNHLPLSEYAHFGQHKTAQALYDAVVARYSSPAAAALGRLLLPYLFPELCAFATVKDMVSHLRTSDARCRAAVSAEFLDKNQPPMFITLYFIVTHLPDSLHSVRDHFLSLDPTSLTVDLLEQHLLAAETRAVAVGAARGTPRPPFFEGCSPSPLAPSYASAAAAAADISVAEDVG
ncbi:unnamed protein product, partial [Closterium sp. NIES-54]